MAMQKLIWDPGAVDLDETKNFCASLPRPESWFPAGCEKRRYSSRISIKEALGWGVGWGGKQSGWESRRLRRVTVSWEPHTFDCLLMGGFDSQFSIIIC